ncbi:hypothetical protein DFH09DRAFT_1105280 [Mycena vulgaris]|nr:hypothetical protein DFH09DRAFT_1105280 [Mycena vulgaris]
MSMTALLELSGGSGLNQAHIHACRQGVRGWEIDSGDINFFRVGCASVMGAGRRFKRALPRDKREGITEGRAEGWHVVSVNAPSWNLGRELCRGGLVSENPRGRARGQSLRGMRSKQHQQFFSGRPRHTVKTIVACMGNINEFNVNGVNEEGGGTLMTATWAQVRDEVRGCGTGGGSGSGRLRFKHNPQAAAVQMAKGKAAGRDAVLMRAIPGANCTVARNEDHNWQWQWTAPIQAQSPREMESRPERAIQLRLPWGKQTSVMGEGRPEAAFKREFGRPSRGQAVTLVNSVKAAGI